MGKINITLNINFKNITKILAIIFGIATIIITTMYFQKYEISELTSSIIRSNLEYNKDENIFELQTKTTIFLETSKFNSNFKSCNCNGTIYLTPDYPLISAIEILNNNKKIKSCCQYEFINISKSATPLIEIKDKNLDIFYMLNYNEKNVPISFSINEIIFNDDYSRKPINYTLKNYLNTILDTHEFTLLNKKYSENEDDYLIKDLGNNFLIYEIFGGLIKPSIITVSLYKKQKYFNNIL